MGTPTLRWLAARLRAHDLATLLLLATTFTLLLGARIALAVIPVRHLIGWQGRAAHDRIAQGEPAEAIATVRWAVLVVARRSPVRFVCFPQCLAGSWMLRRRGLASRLHYGVRREDGRLLTHTWLECAGEIVLGGEVREGFATLAVYG